MTVVFCLDDNNGMLFNNRRQSRDRNLISELIEYSSQRRILTNEFSKSLFDGFEKEVIICDNFIDIAVNDDICFIENIDPNILKDKISTLIIYRWNRIYPADFTFSLTLDSFKKLQTTEFEGSSHEKITKEIYSL